MTDRTPQEILQDLKACVAERREEAREGVMIRREHAAQLAEAAWGELTSTGPDRSAEWLDGCVTIVEGDSERATPRAWDMVKTPILILTTDHTLLPDYMNKNASVLQFKNLKSGLEQG
jgi:hypothetical protein